MMQEKKVILSEIEEEIEEKNEELSRRRLLSKDGLKHIVAVKSQFDNEVEASDTNVKHHNVSVDDIQKIREKKVPDKRSLLSMAMKRAKVPEVFHTLDIKDISFTSQKVLDTQTCTACQMCYRICPTGALSSDTKGTFINFNAMACVQCHSCHDVCEPNSLTLKSTFNLESLFHPKNEILVKFDIRRCDECNNPFAYKSGEVMCERCRVEEEEAKELWGIV
jgi:ferredoxin